MLFLSHEEDVTSLVKFCMENPSHRREYSLSTLTRLVMSFLWLQLSIEKYFIHCTSSQTENECIATSECMKVTA